MEELRPVARLIAQAIRQGRVEKSVPKPATEAGDLRRWETKALKALKSGRKPAVAFKSAAIPEHLFEAVSGRLGLARTPTEVRAAFKATQQDTADPQSQYDSLSNDFSVKVAALAALLAAGTITAMVFHQRMIALIESVYTRAYQLGAAVQGVGAVLTAADHVTITNYVHDEDEYLRRFVRDVSLGHVPDSEAYLQNRAGMYAEAIHGLYWEGRASRVPADYVVYYEAEDDKNTCEPCALNEANGPYPIGRAPIPGNDCLGWSRCRCKLRFVPASQQPIPNIAAGATAETIK